MITNLTKRARHHLLFSILCVYLVETSIMSNFRSEMININYFPLNIDVINVNKQFMSEITLRAWNSSSCFRKFAITTSMLDVLLDRLDGPLSLTSMHVHLYKQTLYNISILLLAQVSSYIRSSLLLSKHTCHVCTNVCNRF